MNELFFETPRRSSKKRDRLDFLGTHGLRNSNRLPIKNLFHGILTVQFYPRFNSKMVKKNQSGTLNSTFSS